MDVLGSASQIQLNLGRTQQDERNAVRALASGLRVQSAADDPSGLAMAESIQSRVNGLQQSVQNVQTANNLLNVADGTLDTVARMLQRIHGLIVQSRSDINSTTQLQGIQSEIDSLLAEVNKVSSGASFNGVKLFDGSHDTSLATNATVRIVQSEPNPDGSPATSTVYDANNTGGPDPGQLITNYANLNPASDIQSSLIDIRIVSASSNPTDPQFGPLGQPGVMFQITAYSDAGSQFGAAPEEQYQEAYPTNNGPAYGNTEVAPSGTGALLNFDLANISQQDVGVGMTFLVTAGHQAGNGTALNVNDSGGEGGLVSISLPKLSTAALNVSDISVLPPDMVDHYTNTVSGQSSSNQYAADFAELRVNDAIDNISQIRAQVGAQGVALQSDATDGSIAIVNETASESAIRDTNVATTTSQFTRDQILTQFGTSVLAQMQTNQQQLMSLLVAQAMR